MGLVEDCEEALVAHWSQLGLLPGGELHEEDGLVWFEAPVRHLPFNGVVRTRLSADASADDVIDRVVARMRGRGADCWWIVHPSATPDDLAHRLERRGLRPVEQMNFMALELGEWEEPEPPAGAAFRLVKDDEGARAYTELTFRYWEIPPEEQEAVAELHRAIAPARLPGRRFLALVDGRPVGKAYLSFRGPPGVASLYGMSVLPEARGRGIAAGLTAAMIRVARERGCHRTVLHATDMAVGVYRRVGFVQCATALVFATAPIWSEDQ